MLRIQVCQWVEDGDVCRQPTLFGKSYCETHHSRVYLTVPTEMADYLIDQELDSDRNFTNSLKGDKQL